MRIAHLAARVALVFAMISILATTASAGAWIQWGDGPQIQLTKVTIPFLERGYGEYYVWQLGSDWNSGFVFDLEADYPQVLTAVGGGDEFLDLQGNPIFVRIAQAVTNIGEESWIDYHIRTADGGLPYKAYGQWWPGDWNTTSVDDGWDFMRDPGGSTAVQPGQVLLNEFWIFVDPATNTFSLETWPTIPEPGSIVALSGGLAALGACLRLRRRA